MPLRSALSSAFYFDGLPIQPYFRLLKWSAVGTLSRNFYLKQRSAFDSCCFESRGLWDIALKNLINFIIAKGTNSLKSVHSLCAKNFRL